MTSPTRRPIKIRNYLHHIDDFLDHHGDNIRLGWSCLVDDLRHSGWPERTPDDDRRPRPPSDPTEEADVLDYADPTGVMAMRRDRLDADREALEDHRHLIETSLHAIELIARRYRPDYLATIPACTHAGCREPVEARRLNDGSPSYVGMVNIGGTWAAKPGATPLCPRHRKQQARRAS